MQGLAVIKTVGLRGKEKMKRKFTPTIMLVAFVAVAITVSGCVTQESYRKKRHKYPLELMPSRHAYVKTGDIYMDSGEFVIEGKVKRSVKSCCTPITGHVDMMVIAGDGSIIDMVTVAISPANIPKTAARQSSYKVKLAYLPPEGATIRARFHGKKFLSGSYENNGSIEDCHKYLLAIHNEFDENMPHPL